MDENNQNNAKPTIDKEYLKKLAEKIKAEKARKEALGKKAESEPTPPPISSISSKYLSDDDEEEIASEKTAIIDLSALSGHAADAKLTIVDGKDSGKNIEITKDEILAGRSLDNDFVISDISVSRKHFKITKEGSRFIISDMGSGNGIKVNGSKTTSATLSDGDIISVGARQIKFEILNPDLKQKPQRTTKQTMPTNYEPEDDDEPSAKKGSSPLVLVAIIVVLLIGIGGVAYFLLFDNQGSQAKTTAVSAPFGENDKAEIEKLIASKDLKNAEKKILAANDRTSGDNPYKSWLNEQIVLIGREKTNQITFENGKTKLAQKNPEGEDLLKSIPASSIFYKDAQNLLLSVPKKEEPKAEPKKAEPKKEEVKEAPKKEEPKKEEVKEAPKKEEPKKEEVKAAPKKEEPKKAEPKAEPKKEAPKAEPKKEAPKAEPKKAEPKPAPEKKAKKATMSEEEAKKLYMEANAMKDEDSETAKKLLQKIINSVDPESKRYKKAKELLEKL
ncbi:FHA domain-containing protein [bacterium]|nr:FHA domain-containing protein [bacterium]